MDDTQRPKHYAEKMCERLADDLATLIIFTICAVLAIGIICYFYHKMHHASA